MEQSLHARVWQAVTSFTLVCIAGRALNKIDNRLLGAALVRCTVSFRWATARQCLEERQQFSEMHVLRGLDVTDTLLPLVGRAATHKHTGGVLWRGQWLLRLAKPDPAGSQAKTGQCLEQQQC